MKAEAIKKRILSLGNGNENFAFFNIHVSEDNSIVALYSGNSIFIKNDFYSYGLNTLSEKTFIYEDGKFNAYWTITKGGELSNEKLEYTEDEFFSEIEELIALAEKLGDCYEQKVV